MTHLSFVGGERRSRLTCCGPLPGHPARGSGARTLLAWAGGGTKEAGTAAGRRVSGLDQRAHQHGPARQAGLARLHELLVRVAAGELHRREVSLPDRFGTDPGEHAAHGEMITAIRRAVDHELTDRQRRLFIAIVLNGIPLDAVVDKTGMTRNAIYKAIFDARRKIRAFLIANGNLEEGKLGSR
jgi:DNA-directed RNA polymerase specialized sigma24 family protein